MEATITTIGDIFKKKVEDSVKVPTIWIDLNGEEHEDYKHTHIESRDVMRSDWHASPDAPSYVDKKTSNGPDFLFVQGYIKQIGSHVIYCGRLADRADEYPCLDNLIDVFKYACNLEYVCKGLSGMTLIHRDYQIPEDLFWNCPKLKEITRFFEMTQVETVPANLLSKCPNLESVEEIFYSTNVKEIPEDLFKNNPKITNFGSAFDHSEVQKIPDHLFDSVKEGLLNGTVNIDGFAEYTRVCDSFRQEDPPKTKEERINKRKYYLPKDLPREIQWRLLSTVDNYPPETF